MLRLISALVAMSCVIASMAAHAACDGRQRLPDHAKKPIYLADDTLFFRTKDIQLDLDGASHAYGVRDQGLEDICNGLSSREPPQCRDTATGCTTSCRAAFRAADGNVSKIESTMCTVGLGSSDKVVAKCKIPKLRLQPPPNDAWFVSQTAFYTKPPPGISVATWISSQSGQIDPLTIPYFVIPAEFRNGKLWDASPGDVGVVVDAANGRTVSFIIGDVGGKLDEGSAALIAALKGLPALVAQSRPNAFGVATRRLIDAKSGDFAIAIFRHTTQRLLGRGDVLAIESAVLPEHIAQLSIAKLAAVGGKQRVLDCSAD